MGDERVIIVKFKASEKTCIDFIENQDNYSNAIKYLIIKEVHENGMKNLSRFIPSRISDEFFEFMNYNRYKPENFRETSYEDKILDKNKGKQLSPISSFTEEDTKLKPIKTITSYEMNNEEKVKNKEEIKEVEIKEEIKAVVKKVEIKEQIEEEEINKGITDENAEKKIEKIEMQEEISEEIKEKNDLDDTNIPSCYL